MRNYHTHTKRCRHAVGEDEQYVEAAIKAGMEEIGFSDHAPMVFPNGYTSSFRMYTDDTAEYVNSIRSLEEKYKDQISIKLGYELEYYPDIFEKELTYLKSFGYDYLILGQHFTFNELEPYAHYSGQEATDKAVLEQYVNQVLAALNTGEFSYIAHPDIINFTGDTEFYKEKMEYLCREIKKFDIPIEFNMLGFSEKRHYPNKAFWEIVSQVKNKVIIGFDAHRPKALLAQKTYDSMLAYLDKLGIQPIEAIDFKK